MGKITCTCTWSGDSSASCRGIVETSTPARGRPSSLLTWYLGSWLHRCRWQLCGVVFFGSWWPLAVCCLAQLTSGLPPVTSVDRYNFIAFLNFGMESMDFSSDGNLFHAPGVWPVKLYFLMFRLGLCTAMFHGSAEFCVIAPFLVRCFRSIFSALFGTGHSNCFLLYPFNNIYIFSKPWRPGWSRKL